MAIKINLVKNNLDKITQLFFVKDDSFFNNSEILNLQPNLKKLLDDTKFKTESKSIAVIPNQDGQSYLIFVGLGKLNNKNLFNIESLRRSIAKVLRSLNSYSIKELFLELPDGNDFGISKKHLAQQVTTTLLMANYIFDDYITEDSRKQNKDFEINILSDSNEVEEGVKVGEIIGNAVNRARHWIDLPPSTLTPVELAQKAKEIADEGGLKYTVFNEQDVKEMGMGGLAGVASGSEQECRFVIMEYKVNENAPTVGIVGKGITFDSGGLSLKPPTYMETMKEDMSGASSVIATMDAIAKLKPNVNVIAFAPMTENLPGDGATKPGDILKFYNGKTAEVKNTDAEGRLILADALAYAHKNYKPDVMLDAATLTGACAHALGPYFTGLFSEHDDVAKLVEEAAERSGDYVWRLPLTDDYKAAIKSEVADLCNIGKGNIKAGGTTAAAFLQNFVGDTPWAHLDIAGTAFDVPGVSYYRSWSATGASVRLFIDFIMNYKK